MAATVLLMTPFASCSEDSAADEGVRPPVTPGDEVRLEVFAHTPDFALPSTRIGSANEDGIGDDIWVLVFRGTGNSAIYAEAQKAYVNGGKKYVTLKKDVSPTRLLVIANNPRYFFDGTSAPTFTKENLDSFLAGKTFDECMNEALLTAPLQMPVQPQVPYAGTSIPKTLIPMSAMVEAPGGIDQNTRIGTSSNPVVLKRIVAKVTVINEDPDFVLMGAAVLKTSYVGTYWRDSSEAVRSLGTEGLTDIMTSATGDGVTGIAPAVNGSTASNPIYIYESAAGDDTSVIIKGVLSGTIYYYKIAFVSGERYIDIERNKHYSFTIKKVGKAGYVNTSGAKDSVPANITFELMVVDDISSELIDNGEYYLGTSNTEAIIYATKGSVMNNVIAFSIMTNATADMVVSNNSISLSSGSMSFSPSSVNLAQNKGDIARTDVKVTIPVTFGSSAKIKVQLGELSRTITVYQANPLSSTQQAVSLGTDFMMGQLGEIASLPNKSWITLSDHPDYGMGYQNDVIINESGGIYAHIASNGYGTRYAEIYLSRLTGQSQGRVKVRIMQN